MRAMWVVGLLLLAACGGETVTVGGTASGVHGVVTLTLDAQKVTVTNDGPYTFPESIPSDTDYRVVKAAATPADCVLSNASGRSNTAPITDVNVTCGSAVGANTYPVSVQVTGLQGTMTLVNLGRDPLPISSDGVYSFSQPMRSGDTYYVAIGAQPDGQTCTVNEPVGSLGAAGVTVYVACTSGSSSTGSDAGSTTDAGTSDPTPTHELRVAVSGLLGTLQVRNNASDTLTLSSSGTYTFGTALTTGTAYNVTVVSQPSNQTCTVTSHTGAMGSVDITLSVSCVTNTAPTFQIRFFVTNMVGTVTVKNGSDSVTATANTFYAFPTRLTSGSPYSVSVTSQPASQTCTVVSGSGTVAASDVNNIVVSCSNKPATNF